MECLNKIEIQGRVSNIKLTPVQDKTMAQMSVATDYAYRGRDNMPVIETTWHNVIAWEGVKTQDIKSIKKNDIVRVVGRVRTRTYITSTGDKATSYEIFANEVSLIQNSEQA